MPLISRSKSCWAAAARAACTPDPAWTPWPLMDSRRAITRELSGWSSTMRIFSPRGVAAAAAELGPCDGMSDLQDFGPALAGPKRPRDRSRACAREAKEETRGPEAPLGL